MIVPKVRPIGTYKLPLAENSAIVLAFVLTTYKLVGRRNLYLTCKHFKEKEAKKNTYIKLNTKPQVLSQC